MFTDPSSAGELVDFKAETSPHVGKLCLIEPKGVQHGVQTENGVADALIADLTFIDEPGGPAETLNTWIFARGIAGKCEHSIGEKVLGRIVKTVSKGGRPYLELSAATDPDKAMAAQYVTWRDQQRQANQFAQPQAPVQQQQAPPQQQYQAPPQQAPQQWQQPPAQAPAPQQAPPQQQQPWQAPPQQAPQQQQQAPVQQAYQSEPPF